jgi:DNA-binding MarR family transcriptional regulator
MIIMRYRFVVATSESAANGADAAFLIAQVGAHAAEQFRERLAGHDLTPPLAGILRLLRSDPALSQQALAERLGMFPSRVVALVDELEARGLVRRERSTEDRRLNVLVLSADGSALLRTIGGVARAHNEALLGALSGVERERLAVLLRRVAEQQGLAHHVHPGYRNIGTAR